MAPATAKAETGDPVQAQAVRDHICLIKESGFYSVETPWKLFKQESNVLQRQAVAEMGENRLGEPEGEAMLVIQGARGLAGWAVKTEGVNQDVLGSGNAQIQGRSRPRRRGLGRGCAHEFGLYSIAVGPWEA